MITNVEECLFRFDQLLGDNSIDFEDIKNYILNEKNTAFYFDERLYEKQPLFISLLSNDEEKSF